MRAAQKHDAEYYFVSLMLTSPVLLYQGSICVVQCCSKETMRLSSVNSLFSLSVFIVVGVIVGVGGCFVSAFVQTPVFGTSSSTTGITSSSLNDQSKNDDDADDSNNSPAPCPPERTEHIDTSAYVQDQEALLDWLNSLKHLERSEPDWVGQDILTLSPSLLVQEHLESLIPLGRVPEIFPTESARAKFDWDWRYSLLKLMEPKELQSILAYGRSNTHPLRLQLVACPANCEFQLHAHVTVELDIPLVGELWERRALNTILPKEMLTRRADHAIGSPLSDFSAKPTREELIDVGNDLAQRVVLNDTGPEGAFVTRRVVQGECLVNDIGSVHQSFTSPTSPCLLWVLGANVHAHFMPGNFGQRTGVDQLTGIDHLLDEC
jgi:hypothetical protein